ncbi:MAG: CYTH domain-containing protein [Candidatus Aenigmarchaeota archaeon]|nr:CYTH domain-containing protein [Candidatus Aenigmarchaeota archaeon]
MIELERTFLAKAVPAGIEKYKSKEIVDVYIPASHPHPTLRIRKEGDKFFLTKKQPVAGDASEQKEQTVELSREEFETLSSVPGKVVQKIRFYYPFEGRTAEIDVFQGQLRGLVLVDFEFSTPEDKAAFTRPDFCLADVTQEEFIAGGKLCGKCYKDIESQLQWFGYTKLEVCGK